MKKLSKNKQLNDVLLFQQMLLWETTGGVLGQEPKHISDIPFVERLKFLTAMQNSALIANKVDPVRQTSGLSDLRDMLKNDQDEEKGGVPLAVDNGENDDSAANSDRRIKPVNGSAASALFAAAAESANYDAEGNEITTQ